jgi:perosamine synthetase
VAEPALVGNEEVYVLECLRTSWISSNGRFIEEFERGFAAFCGTRHAVACSTGTAALHLALLALGVGPGDEVIVPALTFVATANAVQYCGGVPVFVDSDPETFNLDPARVAGLLTPRTRGIIAVHLYGNPVDGLSLRSIARDHRLFLLEDAAEAHGARLGDLRAGALGDAATFSFYGNKLLTTGEGGMVTTDDDALASRVRLLRGQGMDLQRRYWFPVVGFNYRMTNIAAAIGLAQLEMADWHLERRSEVACWYRERLSGIAWCRMQQTIPGATSVHWMNSLVLKKGAPVSRDDLGSSLAKAGIETRPFFIPIHELPPYRTFAAGTVAPVAEDLGRSGLSLPTSALLTEEEVDAVCREILAAAS